MTSPFLVGPETAHSPMSPFATHAQKSLFIAENCLFFHTFASLLENSLTLSLTHLVENSLPSSKTHSQTHSLAGSPTFSLSLSHPPTPFLTLSITPTHSLYLDMLNNFCFHV